MKSATPNFSSCPQAGKSKFLEPGADFFSCYLLPLPFAWLLIQMHLDLMHLVHQSNSDSTMHQPYLAAIQSIICYFNQTDNCSLKYGIILTLKSIHHITRGGAPCIILSCRGLFRVQSWASPNLELANRSKLNTITGKRLNLEQKNLCLLNPDWELCQEWLTDPIRWEPSVLISTARCS